MRTKYSAYYRPRQEELKEASDTALFVFDTNCLLDILRISPELAKKTLGCIEKYKERIRIPSHVDREYHKHLFEIPAQVLAIAENKKETFSFSLIEKPIREHFEKSGAGCQFPSDRLEKYLSVFREIFDRTLTEMDKLVGYYRNNFESHAMQTRISDLLKDLILPDFTPEEVAKIKEEGKDRYERKIPPGYMDSPKATETDDNN